MRGAFLALPLLLLACESEPTFEERYEETQKRIQEKAEALDAELAEPPSPASSETAEP
ncbi:MAG: hypothetical protein HKO05_06720 [Erythrobacter sp.]|jgi:hypothetical protein|nr:hypothetical protein [Erythrobacter sp.]